MSLEVVLLFRRGEIGRHSGPPPAVMMSKKRLLLLQLFVANARVEVLIRAPTAGVPARGPSSRGSLVGKAAPQGGRDDEQRAHAHAYLYEPGGELACVDGSWTGHGSGISTGTICGLPSGGRGLAGWLLRGLGARLAAWGCGVRCRLTRGLRCWSRRGLIRGLTCWKPRWARRGLARGLPGWMWRR